MANDDRAGKESVPKPPQARRPEIPSAISREVLIESGHRCAVCGDGCSLERAHIIPWRESREHRLENLICLCATCHERADKEEWGAKTLHEYKRRPWILRKGTESAAPQPTKRVQLVLAMEYASFDATTQRILVHALAAFLNIPPEAIKVCSVEEGSVKLVVELPAAAAERLTGAGVISLEDYLDSLGEIRVSAAPETSEFSMVETVGSAAQLADLKAQAWHQYAHALRVSGQLAAAEAAFDAAQRFCEEEGTGDPLLRAQLLTGRASLRISQGRCGEAITLADKAAHIYSKLDESSSVASAMVSKAVAQIYAGEIEAAVRTLDRAIPLIDSENDPKLLLAACHNLIRCYLDLEQPEQALSLYFETRHLYQEFSDPLIVLKAAWQEGQLLRDLGHLKSAEAALLRARQGFQERDLLYEAAMVSLDLADVYLKLDMVQSLRETVAATVPIFRALGLDREPLAMLLQLGQVDHQSRQAFRLIQTLTTRVEELKSSKQ